MRTSSILRSFSLIAAATAAAGCSASQPTSSNLQGFQYSWAGNTLSGAGTKVTTGFAVLNRSRGTAGDSWGTGFAGFDEHFIPGRDFQGDRSPRLDTSAKYIYLYQDVNQADSASFLELSRTEILPEVERHITSWGVFSGLGFADDMGPVSAANVFGEREPGQNPHAALTGVDLPRVIDIARGQNAGIDPDEVILNPNRFIRKWSEGRFLPIGGRGTIVAFTTDLPPTFGDNDTRPDPIDSRPSQPANPGEVQDGSPEAIGVLKLLNRVTGAFLLNTVHISASSAQRLGKVNHFNTLQEVLSLVTDADFRILVQFAIDNGYVVR